MDRGGFVEIVDIEHQLAGGRSEATEVRQVRVAAQLDLRPDCGVAARSAAISAAAPRKNANGEASIRPCRMGTSSATRPAACSSSTSSGAPAPG